MSASPTDSIQNQAAYGVGEAAHILALPAATVRAWSFGQQNQPPRERVLRFQPVIKAADTKLRLLSFANLCELHLLAVIRRHHRVTLPKVRKAVRYMEKQLRAERPLLSKDLLTNGVDLFVASADHVLTVSSDGQQALRDDFEQALSRVKFDNRSGQVLRLFPFTAPPEHQTHHAPMVVVDPSTSFGRPVIASAGVRTEVIAQRFAAGDCIQEMADDYGVPSLEIEEALRFERAA